MQGAAPPGEYCPATHVVQPVDPFPVLYCPDGHVVHTAAAVVLEKVPGSQDAHGTAPPLLACPAVHVTHDDWPASAAN